MRSTFKMNMQDMLNYISKHLKSSVPKDLKDKYNETFKEEDEDFLEDLTSLDSKTKKIEKNLMKKVTLLLLLIPVTIFFGQAIYKTYVFLKNQKREVLVSDENITQLSLSSDETYKWRILKDQETKNLNNKIIELSSDMKDDLNSTSNSIKKDTQQQTDAIKQQIEQIKYIVLEDRNNTTNRFNELAIKQQQLSKKIQTSNQKLKSKIKNIKVSNTNTSNKYNLPKLPPLKNAKKLGTTSFINKDAKDINGFDKKNITKNQIKSVEYEIVEDEIEEENIEIKIGLNEKKEIDKTLPNFTIMPGFAKGILLNAGEVATINNGDDKNSVTPIYIRLNGEQLISNDESVDLDGCLVIATARGNMSKQAVDMRLNKISCNLTDIDGNSYRAEQKISGWVFSETGEWGIKGRLVSREEQIIKAGLPLAIVESMVKALSTAVGTSNTNVLMPDAQTTSALNNLRDGGMQGLSSGASNVLKKFSDYYMKLLESLNPTISIRAGREVVVAFKGGESIAVEKYEPIDLEYFENEKYIEMEEDVDEQ